MLNDTKLNDTKVRECKIQQNWQNANENIPKMC